MLGRAFTVATLSCHHPAPRICKTPKMSMVPQAGPCRVTVGFVRDLNGDGRFLCTSREGASSLNECALKIISIYF